MTGQHMTRANKNGGRCGKEDQGNIMASAYLSNKEAQDSTSLLCRAYGEAQVKQRPKIGTLAVAKAGMALGKLIEWKQQSQYLCKGDNLIQGLNLEKQQQVTSSEGKLWKETGYQTAIGGNDNNNSHQHSNWQ